MLDFAFLDYAYVGQVKAEGDKPRRRDGWFFNIS
jgi:hypothetical protein